MHHSGRGGRGHRVLVGVTALLLAIGGVGCTAAAGGQPKAAQMPAIPVVITEVQPQDVPIYADFAAQSYARHLVEVRGRVEGYIERWLFQPGAEVRAGQVLYVLDLRPYEAALEQARGSLRQSEADLEFARRQVSVLQAQANLTSAQANSQKARQDYDRLAPLVAADAASKQDMDAVSAALKVQEASVTALQANLDQTKLSTSTQIDAMQGRVEALRAAVKTAELNLEYGTIRAPVSGRVGDSLIPVGGLVTPNAPQPLTTIVPLDPIWVRFKVTEPEYLSWSKRGRTVLGSNTPLKLVLADDCDFPWPGHIENALNQMDPKTGTLELQARFPNPQRTLLAGQFGRIRVQVDERKDALMVPQRAVQQLQNMQMVYALDRNNRVEARPVTTGARAGDGWVIEKGLEPGDRVIVEGQMKVRPGVLVRPLAQAPGAGGPAGN